MSWTYKMGIFLISHVHILILDRESADELNQLLDVDTEDSPDPGSSFLLCGSESRSLPNSLQDLKSRLENILCTVVSGANYEERSSFRRPLKQLERTNIYRYQNSCAHFRTRDCLVLDSTRRFLNQISSKFEQLIRDLNPSNSTPNRNLNDGTNNNQTQEWTGSTQPTHTMEFDNHI